MHRYIAFLRAINVGGHTVKMEVLRQLFERVGFSDITTFIASGNVFFTAPSKSAGVLEQKLERELRAALGYEVATFIRTEGELADIAAYVAFPPKVLAGAVALNVAFMRQPLADEEQPKLRALRTEIDDFAVRGRELYWLCRQKQSDSTFSNAVLEKTLGRPSTLRGLSTLQKMAALCRAVKLLQ